MPSITGIGRTSTPPWVSRPSARWAASALRAISNSARRFSSDMVKGKLAVVTGGANGIGWAAARLLAASGASVCIFDREQPAEDIGARWFAVDVTSRQSIDEAFAAAGTPDIVVANAGVAE